MARILRTLNKSRAREAYSTPAWRLKPAGHRHEDDSLDDAALKDLIVAAAT